MLHFGFSYSSGLIDKILICGVGDVCFVPWVVSMSVCFVSIVFYWFSESFFFDVVSFLLLMIWLSLLSGILFR
jgi:hypothetical protein